MSRGCGAGARLGGGAPAAMPAPFENRTGRAGATRHPPPTEPPRPSFPAAKPPIHLSGGGPPSPPPQPPPAAPAPASMHTASNKRRAGPTAASTTRGLGHYLARRARGGKGRAKSMEENPRLWGGGAARERHASSGAGAVRGPRRLCWRDPPPFPNRAAVPELPLGQAANAPLRLPHPPPPLSPPPPLPAQGKSHSQTPDRGCGLACAAGKHGEREGGLTAGKKRNGGCARLVRPRTCARKHAHNKQAHARGRECRSQCRAADRPTVNNSCVFTSCSGWCSTRHCISRPGSNCIGTVYLVLEFFPCSYERLIIDQKATLL